MIAYVKGTVECTGEDYAVIDNNGIGYYISMPVSDVQRIKNEKGTVKVNTYHYVREDAIGLYGFIDIDALNIFKLLINVSGVGPKAALSMLSSISPESIILAIMAEDDKKLCKAQGVGKKIASRIILELKDKFKNYDMTPDDNENIEKSDNVFEAISALIALGYTRSEAVSAVQKAGKQDGVEAIVKQALKILMKG